MGVFVWPNKPGYRPVGYRYTHRAGTRRYELTNHLGNVLATVSDRKLVETGVTKTRQVKYRWISPYLECSYNPADFPGLVLPPCIGTFYSKRCPCPYWEETESAPAGFFPFFEPDVLTATDYYPFGMEMPGRKYNPQGYRYGFNGKENDRSGEWGLGLVQDYGFRLYNPGLGRFFSVDPLTESYPWNSTYAFAENDVIRCIDLEGAEKLQRTSGHGNEYARPAQDNLPSLRFIYNPTQVNNDARRKAIQKAGTISTYKGQGEEAARIEMHGIQKEFFKQHGETAAGFTPVGILLDIKDFCQAFQAGDKVGVVVAGIGFAPFGDAFKPLKRLIGAGVYGKCEDFASSFMGKYNFSKNNSMQLFYKGSDGKIDPIISANEVNLKTTQRNGIEIDGVVLPGQNRVGQVTDNGKHTFIEAETKSGKRLIFDNAHPDGIERSKYMSKLSIGGGGSILQGEEAVKKFEVPKA